MHIQLLVLGAIATIVFLILRVKKGGLPAAVAKTCASIFFVFTGLASAFDTLPAFGSLSVGFATFNPWSFYIIGGLVCAVLGDLWLDLKYTYLENSNEFTALGMSFFLGTQVLYFVGAFNCFKWNDNASYIYASIVVGAIFALICVFGERRFLKVKFGKFKAISAVYSGVLGFVMVFTICCAISDGESQGAKLMALGEVLLWISDMILVKTYFGEGMNKKKHVLWNHILYYAAQYLIAVSIASI